MLRLVADGLTDAQVAERLGVSLRTVHTHLHSIYRRLDVPSRSAASRYAVEHRFPYRIEDLLGRGGMGVVYRGYDVALERSVALKLLTPSLAEDREFRERFLVESRLAAALEHPNVVPIHDAGEADGQLYLAMRYVEGTDLKGLLQAEGPLEPARAIAICAQVAEALDAAHARGLVHRDVKPSNVLLDEREHAYLADFGLTRRLTDQAPGFEAGLSLGTPAYVAPEQIEGKEVDGRADQYSLACMLHQCLTGKPPFPRGSEAAVLYAHLEEVPPAPAGLGSVIPRALSKDPADRYPSCRAFLADARTALGLEPRRTRWPLALAGLGAALIGAALLAFFLTKGGGGVPPEPGADSLVRIDPQTNQVVDTMPVGRKASAVAVGAGYVWVTSTDDGSVWRITPSSGKVLKLAVNATPTDVAVTGGRVVVANGPDGKVAVFDASTGAGQGVTQLTAAGAGSLQLSGGSGGLWFGAPHDHTVGNVAADVLPNGLPPEDVLVAPDGSSYLRSYRSFDGLSVGEGAVWVAGDAFGRTVWRVDPATAKVVATIPLPFVPMAIAAGGRGVWVTSLLDDTVSRIDPTTNRVVRTIPGPRGAYAIAADAAGVWVTGSLDDTVTRINPENESRRGEDRARRKPGRRRGRRQGCLGHRGHTVRRSVGSALVTLVLLVASSASASHTSTASDIRIGVLSECGGVLAGFYQVTLAAAELALLERGAHLAGAAPSDGVDDAFVDGHRVSLSFGCDDGTATSALVEARRLVEAEHADILIGPLGGDEELALQDYARRHPHTTFVNGSGSAQMLDPASNFFSFHPDGAAWMAGLGSYAYKQLGWRTAVTISDTFDLFNWDEAAGFTAEFCSLGGKLAKRISIRTAPRTTRARSPRSRARASTASWSPPPPTSCSRWGGCFRTFVATPAGGWWSERSR